MQKSVNWSRRFRVTSPWIFDYQCVLWNCPGNNQKTIDLSDLGLRPMFLACKITPLSPNLIKIGDMRVSGGWSVAECPWCPACREAFETTAVPYHITSNMEYISNLASRYRCIFLPSRRENDVRVSSFHPVGMPLNVENIAAYRSTVPQLRCRRPRLAPHPTNMMTFKSEVYTGRLSPWTANPHG